MDASEAAAGRYAAQLTRLPELERAASLNAARGYFPAGLGAGDPSQRT